ncbi:hypothetical protein BUALT_Bualt09G0082800 [Buddleja alternifolia]|uniref:Uncharacterized protein n=1 Tax=Buddleja alternifolia TaxID=168488 RepID=A0AAV6X916_9LAMI|nr:hypothetical protein BUALT_Bualt09G0082800 [Buddleja alternifolia]
MKLFLRQSLSLSVDYPIISSSLNSSFQGVLIQVPWMYNFHEQVRKTESQAYGVVVNTFEELENRYVDEFRKVKGGVKGVIHLGEEEKPEMKVSRERIRRAIERVMDEGKEGKGHKSLEKWQRDQ